MAQLYEYLAGALSQRKFQHILGWTEIRPQVTIVDETHPITRENILDEKVTITGRDGESKGVAMETSPHWKRAGAGTIAHENSQKTVTITAEVADGHNNALLARELQQKLDGLQLPRQPPQASAASWRTSIPCSIR